MNQLLVFAVAFAITVIFCVSCFTIGKIEADTMRYARQDGITVSVCLENGTKKEIEQLEKLDYVENLGREYDVGGLYTEYEEYCNCSYVDSDTFEKMYAPVYTDLCGSYPVRKEEIMVSKKALEYMGITKPQVGMEIRATFNWNDLKISKGYGEQKFILSGYYTDDSEGAVGKTKAYISKERLKSYGVPMESGKVWIDLSADYWNQEQIEKTLYQDVKLSEEGQHFIANTSAKYRAMEHAFGGYGMCIFLSVAVLGGLFFFVYNITFTLQRKVIKQYGLMEVLGVSQKEIRKMLRIESGRIWFYGSFFATVLSLILGWKVIPFFLKRLSMQDVGNVQGFHLEILLLAIGLSGIILFGATQMSTKELKTMSPMEAFRYEMVDESQYEGKGNSRFLKKNVIAKLAIRNVLRCRKTYILTVFSLVLGCVLGLGAVCLSKGTDVLHAYGNKPDFQIMLTPETVNVMPKLQNKEIWSNSLLGREEVDWIETHVDSLENLRITEGVIPIYGEALNHCLDVLSVGAEDRIIVLEPVYSEKSEELREYFSKEHIKIDVSELEKGDGFVVAHQHLLSKGSKGISKRIGEYADLYRMVPEGEMIDDSSQIVLKNLGYLDLTEKGVPELGITWEQKEVVYLLVGETMWKQTVERIPRQIFSITFDVKRNEATTKQILKEWMIEKNEQIQQMEGEEIELLYLLCNSDSIHKEKQYIEGAKFIMSIVCVCLIIVGILNFFHTFTSEIFSRKHEFSVMESLGMSKRKIRKMLIMEGIFYCASVTAIVSTFGLLVLYVMQKIVSLRVEYYYFNLPILEFFIMEVCLLLVCVIVPYVLDADKKE